MGEPTTPHFYDFGFLNGFLLQTYYFIFGDPRIPNKARKDREHL